MLSTLTTALSIQIILFSNQISSKTSMNKQELSMTSMETAFIQPDQ